MEVYLNGISERAALVNDVFQCVYSFSLVTGFNRVVEKSYEAVKVCLQVFYHLDSVEKSQYDYNCIEHGTKIMKSREKREESE